MKTNRAGEPLYSEILPNLFMGGTEPNEIVRFPQRLGLVGDRREFDSVATFYAYAQPMSWFVFEARFGFEDSFITTETEERIVSIARWLHSEWKMGKRVLSRCEMGWNRSGLCLGIILLIEGYSVDEAISLIRLKRSPDALSNAYFVQSLRRFANGLDGGRALSANPNPVIMQESTR